MEKLVDRYGREIRSLRFSVTRRCNLRCFYCHNEGEPLDPKGEISVEMVAAIVSVALKHFGVRKVKFSGGEPLMRADFVDIVASLPKGLSDVSMTTNGVLLRKYAKKLAAAGLRRVNISLDTLNEEKYDFITGTKGNLQKVLDGVVAAVEAGLTPVKLNMVLLRGVNDDEVPKMMEFVRECSRDGVVKLQLIELMDFKGDLKEFAVDFSDVEHRLRAVASAAITRKLHRRRIYVVDGVEVEVVRPMDNTEFCKNCTRLRVTSDGRLKPCLLRNDNLVRINSTDEEEIKAKLKLAASRRAPFYAGSL
ncbi:MAG: GTP 3' 8-cyclase [Candidatus Alkanophagales archaeon MCA70_species_2]|nr:GTP 3' 8-cyclase [Candidatus Alkanophaga liquidiphilum]